MLSLHYQVCPALHYIQSQLQALPPQRNVGLSVMLYVPSRFEAALSKFDNACQYMKGQS